MYCMIHCQKCQLSISIHVNCLQSLKQKNSNIFKYSLDIERFKAGVGWCLKLYKKSFPWVYEHLQHSFYCEVTVYLLNSRGPSLPRMMWWRGARVKTCYRHQPQRHHGTGPGRHYGRWCPPSSPGRLGKMGKCYQHRQLSCGKGRSLD